MSGWIDRPAPFAGTREEVVANNATHRWSFDGDVLVCVRCDSKSWHESASYSCGEDPPREIIFADEAEFISAMAVKASAAHEIDRFSA
jgi:hypothetical protein